MAMMDGVRNQDTRFVEMQVKSVQPIREDAPQWTASIRGDVTQRGPRFEEMQLNERPRVVELKVTEDEDPESKSRGSHGVVLRGEG